METDIGWEDLFDLPVEEVESQKEDTQLHGIWIWDQPFQFNGVNTNKIAKISASFYVQFKKIVNLCIIYCSILFM